MDETKLREAALQLLGRATALPDAEVELRLRQALDPEYWRKFSPDLSIGPGAHACGEAIPLTEEDVGKHVRKLNREGYFQAGPVLDPLVIARMRRVIERLRDTGWPPVFSFVYDEFWDVVRTPSLHKLVSRFLGEGYEQNSLMWTYYVVQAKGASGWPPHTDSKGRDTRLTVWVPLSDATVENGCIYVIPSDQVPPGVQPNYRDIETVTKDQLSQFLRAARALPAVAGTLMGWHHELVHWGSSATGDAAPRISIAVEFCGPTATLRKEEEPLFSPSHSPSFTERIQAISKGILGYAKFEPLMTRFETLSVRMREETLK